MPISKMISLDIIMSICLY